jgi:hypothetical protein
VYLKSSLFLDVTQRRFFKNVLLTVHLDNLCNDNQLYAQFILIYSASQPLHVSDMFTAHHQEVCIVRGGIQNIPNSCHHLYSSCGSAKHRWMVGLPCIVSQCAKLHVAGWKQAVFTLVYLMSCTWPEAIFTTDQRKEQSPYPAVSGERQDGCHPPPTVPLIYSCMYSN